MTSFNSFDHGFIRPDGTSILDVSYSHFYNGQFAEEEINNLSKNFPEVGSSFKEFSSDSHYFKDVRVSFLVQNLGYILISQSKSYMLCPTVFQNFWVTGLAWQASYIEEYKISVRAFTIWPITREYRINTIPLVPLSDILIEKLFTDKGVEY